MKGLKKTRSVRSLVLLAYGVVSIGALTVHLAVSYLFIRSQLLTSRELFLQKIQITIENHENELLNELALQDREALQAHVHILRKELGVDSIVLRSSDLELFSKEYEKESVGSRLISGILGENQLIDRRALANDFGSLRLELETKISHALEESVLNPALRHFGLSLALTLFVISGLFAAVYWMLWLSLIRPLQQMTIRTVRSREPSDSLLETPIAEIQALAKSLLQTEELKRKASLADLARQVSHDIQSPLSSLEYALDALNDVKEESRALVKRPIQRIREISHALLENQGLITHRASRGTPQVPSVHLGLFLDGFVSEKRLEYPTKSAELIDYVANIDPFDCFVTLDPTQLRRALSNLINNAIDASPSHSKIRLELDATQETFDVRVIDCGQGIPPAVLEKLRLGSEVTYGKRQGHGLGFAQVHQFAQKSGTEILIESEVGHGTTVTLRCPKALMPMWFLPKLVVSPNQPVVILDDDPSIHAVWNHCFQELARSGAQIVRLYHARTSQEFRQHLADSGLDQSAQFLMDQELRDDRVTGLALIEEYKLQNRSVLVTSRFEDSDIQNSCTKRGIKILPKPLLSRIPLEWVAPQEVTGPLHILLEDDEIVRDTWETAAASAGVRLRTFARLEELERALAEIPKSSAIYLDHFLADGDATGEQVGVKLREIGYKRVVLTTGLAEEDQAFELEVVGKAPPWKAPDMQPKG